MGPIVAETEINHGVAAGDGKGVHLGIDAGSVSVNLTVVGVECELLEQQYHRHQGRPVQVLRDALADVFTRWDPSEIGSTAVTGSAGKLIGRLLGIPFVNEIIAQARGIKGVDPQVRTLIEMGGQDSKVIFLKPGDCCNEAPFHDFAMNTVCAAGTGSFLDQQASRLGVAIEDEFGRLALQSTHPPRVAGRCSVFAKSDMIHLQQQATPVHEIIAGLCLGLARNLKANLGKGKAFVKPIAFCGGVAANAGVASAFETVFDLSPGELIVPECHTATGAFGAVLAEMPQWDGTYGQFSTSFLDGLDEYLKRSSTSAGDRLAPLAPPQHIRRSDPPQRPAENAQYAGQKTRAWLGLDVGSISTKIAVVDEQDRVLAKSYLMTAGRPIEAVQKCLRIVGEALGESVEICGCATTGSGRYLTGDFIGADLIVNEITAQATAAALIDPAVDTIFEIGGQDSKYISLNGGVVVDFEMNHACAAGTGSFLEEQAERLGISIKQQFAELALKCPAPCRLGERCTVFMETDLLSYQQQGAGVEELVSGLAYSIVTNYLNRVVGHRKIGQRIFFQGGTAFNRAVVAAFEKVTGQPVTVPPHHEVTGSIGIAHLARRMMQREAESRESKFRGFDLANIEYDVKTFECSHCANACEIKEVAIDGREPLFYGSRCDRYNLKEKDAALTSDSEDLFTVRDRLLKQYARLNGNAKKNRPTIGLPMGLTNYQLLPFWGTFFSELGFGVSTSGRSTKKVVHAGVEAVLAQTCFPVKVMHGHVLKLLKDGVDFIFLPAIVSMTPEFPEAEFNQLCPYVQSIPYQIEAMLDSTASAGVSPAKLLKPPVHFQYGEKGLVKDLSALCSDLGVNRSMIRRGVGAAMQAQNAFEHACREEGRKALDQLSEDRTSIVVVGRPYNTTDPGLSLDLPGKLAKLGVRAIPMDFLDLTSADTESSWANPYWKYGQRIMRAGAIIRNTPNLNAIYLSNFSCGPDSFLQTFFKQLMGEQASLILEIDEHSAAAGVITRLEAFIESLNAAGLSPQDRVSPPAVTPTDTRSCSTAKRSACTLYVPSMADHAHLVAAAFRHCGQPSEVLPEATPKTLQLGRQHTSGKECLPCILTTGDMLAKLEENADASQAAFFMPSGSGPCRFGQYNCLHRMVLTEKGLSDVPVISPSQDKSFYEDFKNFRKDPTVDAWYGIAAVELLIRVLHHVRPYEKDPGRTDELYQAWLTKMTDAMSGEGRKALTALLPDCAREFAAVPVDRTDKKPRIGIVGEIYVRWHRFSNEDLVRTLERLGAEVNMATFCEWMYYTNFTRKRMALRERSWGEWFTNWGKDKVQKAIERRLARPFARAFASLPLVEPPIDDVLTKALPYIHHRFEGEAAVSVGKIVEYAHHGFDGVVNAMPFGCMPSTVVSQLCPRLSRDLDDMPILSVSYDGQHEASRQTRLEAFIHQASGSRSSRGGLSCETERDLLHKK